MKSNNDRVMLNKSVVKSIGHYRSMGIDLEILEEQGDEIRVKIAQNRLINGLILNQKQLVERAKAIFPQNYKVIVTPVVYSLDLQQITIAWIDAHMKKYGVHRKDFIRQIGVDKSTLSSYLNGTRKMNKLVKAAFYYYFLTYQLNTDLRKQLE
jgi:hypothetical protein